MNREQTERKICAAICQSNGLKAKEIARQLNLDRSTVNRVLYASPLLKDLCYLDDDYRWHGIIRQSVPHDGLYEFSGYYAKVSVFLSLTEDEWMDELMKGCQRIGRNLNDTRGLLHSFRDCREQMINLFADLHDMLGTAYLDWEIVFEFRLKRARYVRLLQSPYRLRKHLASEFATQIPTTLYTSLRRSRKIPKTIRLQWVFIFSTGIF